MTQTLQQFVNAWNHRFLDYDHAYGPQCVDLADQYIKDVWGLPVFFVTGAVDMYGHDPAHIEWFANDVGNPNQHPIPGDIVIWHQDQVVGVGVHGHVDVFVSGNGYAFTGFDQNWPVGSTCHLQAHTYEGVKGWGRLRPAPHPNPPPVPTPPPPPAPTPVVPQYLFTFTTNPPDDLKPPDGVMPFNTAMALAEDYIKTHPTSTIDVCTVATST